MNVAARQVYLQLQSDPDRPVEGPGSAIPCPLGFRKRQFSARCRRPSKRPYCHYDDQPPFLQDAPSNAFRHFLTRDLFASCQMQYLTQQMSLPPRRLAPATAVPTASFCHAPSASGMSSTVTGGLKIFWHQGGSRNPRSTGPTRSRRARSSRASSRDSRRTPSTRAAKLESEIPMNRLGTARSDPRPARCSAA
jgi:hypothetical protein